jgi:hypothetical protein
MNIAPVRAVLDRAADARRELRLWWRDDDATTATPELDRLLALARAVQAPVAVAAIPAGLDASLPMRLRDEAGAGMLVHGLAHANHAAPGRKAAEFGDDRPLGTLAAEAGAGLARARDLAGPLLLPVFVPPWNRVTATLAPLLPGLGYVGLSTFGTVRPCPDLVVVNTHLDPVDWRGSRGALDPLALAAALERALADSHDGPIGLLTHHLMFDEPLWAATAALLECLATHPAVRFPSLEELWSAEGRHCTVTCLMT